MSHKPRLAGNKSESFIMSNKGQGKLQDSLKEVKQNQLYELAIVLETIRQVRPDITIDEETYNQVSQLITQFETDTDKHISNILLGQQHTRAAIVAALTKTAPISVSQPAALGEVSSPNTKTATTRLP
jgi:cob(I)alamin adenosyltransferase